MQKLLLIPLAFIFMSAASAPAVCAPIFQSLEKMGSTPDLKQTDPAAHLPDGGVAYCGPVAASNSLAWLASHGYENLLPREHGRKGSEADLANLIGSAKYMDTTYKCGTSPAEVLLGLSRYVKDCGYSYQRLEYEGWRNDSSEFQTGVTVPDLNWIKGGLVGDSAIILNIGWYKFDAKKNQYRRIGGHWVTLVGYGVDEKGKIDPNVIVIHDPAARLQISPGHGVVHIEKISGGTLVQCDGTHSARGFFKMARGMLIDRRASCGIMDGAIVLKMQKTGAAGSMSAGLSPRQKP